MCQIAKKINYFNQLKAFKILISFMILIIVTLCLFQTLYANVSSLQGTGLKYVGVKRCVAECTENGYVTISGHSGPTSCCQTDFCNDAKFTLALSDSKVATAPTSTTKSSTAPPGDSENSAIRDIGHCSLAILLATALCFIRN